MSSRAGEEHPELVHVVAYSAAFVRDMCQSVPRSMFLTPAFSGIVLDLILCCTSILSSELTIEQIKDGKHFT